MALQRESRSEATLTSVFQTQYAREIIRLNWRLTEHDSRNVPADSFPTTKVIDAECWMALFRAFFAEERKDDSEVR